MYTNINDLLMSNLFFPFELLKLKAGIAAGVGILILLGMLLVNIPNCIWFPVLQLYAFTITIAILSRSLIQYDMFKWVYENHPISTLLIAGFIVFFINFIQSLFGNDSERFSGSAAIGRTPFKSPNPFCPPKLDFIDPLDTDTERQTPACIADPNELTEEQRLDEIDIYLRDSQESIARITGYLNTANPDERWISKKEMDNPNNRNIANN